MTKRFIASALLFCLLLGCSGTGWAATVSATEAEMQTLLRNSMRRSEINTALQLNSKESKDYILKILNELDASKKETEEWKNSHAQLLTRYNNLINLSQSQENSISKINESFQIYSKEMKAKVKQEQINGWIKLAAGLGLGFAGAKILSR